LQRAIAIGKMVGESTVAKIDVQRVRIKKRIDGDAGAQLAFIGTPADQVETTGASRLTLIPLSVLAEVQLAVVQIDGKAECIQFYVRVDTADCDEVPVRSTPRV
jgi:hypothetical protein